MKKQTLNKLFSLTTATILSSGSLDAATASWTQEFAAGSTTYRPGTSGVSLPDVAGVVNYNRSSTSGAAFMRATNGEGLFNGTANTTTTEQFSGSGFVVAESNTVSHSGKTSAVFSQDYNLGAVGDKLRLTEAFSWGHMSRDGTWNQDNQVLQFGVMNLGGGSSDNQFFDGTSNSLYLSFVATSGVSRRFNDLTTGTPGSHTGNLTLRNESGILATIATGITFDSNEYLGGGQGAGNFSTKAFWYDIDLELTRGAADSLTVDVNISQLSNLSDTSWQTQSSNIDGLNIENANFHSSSTVLTSAEHGLGTLDTVDLNPAIGINIIDSLNSGASGLGFDSNTFVAIPEPSSILLASFGFMVFTLRRRR